MLINWPTFCDKPKCKMQYKEGEGRELGRKEEGGFCSSCLRLWCVIIWLHIKLADYKQCQQLAIAASCHQMWVTFDLQLATCNLALGATQNILIMWLHI